MIIGFTGKAGVGKDTAGGYLRLKQWKHYSFALPLKRVVATLLGLPLAAMEMREIKDKPLEKPIRLQEEDADRIMEAIPHPILGHSMADKVREACDGKEFNTVRELLQFIGTDIGRDIINKDIWTNITKDAVNNLKKDNNVVITDVRFENEKDVIKDMGGYVIEIQRKTELSDVAKHKSEDIDFESDLVIENNGSMQKMYDQIEEFLNDTKGKRAEA